MKTRTTRVKTLSALGLCTILAACVSTATQVSTDYYSVSGTTADEIDRDIRRNGPMKGHALAVAALSFEPVDIKQLTNDKGCSFAYAKFRVRAKITLPRWTDRLRSKDRDLRRAWRGLSAYAKWHEDQHVKIAENFTRQLSSDLEAIKPQRTCARLDSQAERIVKRNARAHEKAQNAFDNAEQRRLRALMAAS